jgi:L-arabinonolactonase
MQERPISTTSTMEAVSKSRHILVWILDNNRYLFIDWILRLRIRLFTTLILTWILFQDTKIMSSLPVRQEVDLSSLRGSEAAKSNLSSHDAEDSVTATVMAHLIIDCHNQLGEGILYDDRADTLLWTDIYGSQLHTLFLNTEKDPSKGIHTIYNLPKKLCSFGMLETLDTGIVAVPISPSLPISNNVTAIDQVPVTVSSLPLLCAWEDGFQLYDVAKSQPLMDQMSIGQDVNPLKGPTRLNDGRVDPTGRRFVCGGYYGDVPGNQMKVFKVELDQLDQQDSHPAILRHESIVESIRVTNSICWSPDGNVMYLADSPTKQIHRYKYNSESGALSEKTLLHSKPDTENGVPDGSCVDAQGYLWNAVWKPGAVSGSSVQRIDPVTGRVVFTVRMPDTTSQVTCCCFGGDGGLSDMNVLWITTAAVATNSADEPHAGGLYAARVPFQGRRESRLQWTVPKLPSL